MIQSRYSSSELRDINTRNANRLPPATAVHGMAMYELKRHEEQERLFHSAMFDLSHLKQTYAAQQARTDTLEQAVKACAAHHDNERPISLTGVRSIQDALSSFTPSDTDPKAVIKRSTWLMNELDQEAISTEDQVALTTILATNLTQEAKMDLHKAIQHLRDDHVTVTNDLLEVKYKVSKLEDLVRALTAQKTGVQDAPKMAQELEATTRYGKTVILKVPKGQALVPLRTSRSPTPIQSSHKADSAPSSPSAEEDLMAETRDSPVSPLSPTENVTQPAPLATFVAETFEKPLSPVPAASTFPAISGAKHEPLQNTSRNKAPSVADKHNEVSATSSWDIPSLSAAPPAQVAPDTPRVSDQSAPAPRSKGKGKAKKWTDPPIFQEDQVTAAEPTKTLFSYDDDPEPSSNAHGNTMRVEAGELEAKQPEQTSPVRDITNQNQAVAAKTLPFQPLERKKAPAFGFTPLFDQDQKTAATSLPVFQPIKRKQESANTTKWWNKPQPTEVKPFELNFKQESSSTTTAITAQATAPFEEKVKQKPEPLNLESTSNKRSFRDTRRVQEWEPIPLGAKPLLRSQLETNASAKPTFGEVFPPNAMKSMMESVAPKANYVTTPKATAATQENAVPRGPMAFEPLPSRVSKRTESPAASDASKSSSNPAKIARRSAIKKVEAAPSAEQECSAETTDAPFAPLPSAQRTQESEASTASSAAASRPFAPLPSMQRSRDPMASTASSASDSHFPKVPTPTAAVFTPTVTSKPMMNAKSASFQPSTSFGNNATFGNEETRYNSPAMTNASPFQASVMSKLTPEARALFQKKMSEVST